MLSDKLVVFVTLSVIITVLCIIKAVNIKENKYDGEFQIDTSIPDKDIYRIVMYHDPYEFEKRKSLRFKVTLTDQISTETISNHSSQKEQNVVK